MGMSPAWEERAQSPAWALALALAFSLLAMLGTPWGQVPHSAENDSIIDHSSMAQAAAQGLLEGQFPLRVMPQAQLKPCPGLSRYPIFQFYSQVPPLAGGLLVLAGLNPYHAVVLVAGLTFLLGFLGFRWLASQAGSSPAAGLLAAAIYTLAPYHLTDWHSRSALPELAAFAALPWVAAATWGLLRAGGAGAMLRAILAWMLLMLSHPLFHALGLLFMALLALCLALPGRNWKGLLRAGGAYLAALALSAWFLMPGILLGRQMGIANNFHPQIAAVLTPLCILFSPFNLGMPQCTTANMSLQVGAPLWAGWLAALILARSRRQALLLALAAAALLLVWAPFSIWDFLGPLQVVQYPYRLLVFVCLAGALPAAEGWLALRARHRGALVLLALLALAGAWGLGRTPVEPVRPQDLWQGIHGCRAVMPEDDYLMLPSSPGPEDLERGRFRALDSSRGFEVSARDATAALRALEPGPLLRARLAQAQPGSVLLLPSPWYPGLYQVRINGQPAGYGRVGARLAVRLPGGAVDLDYRFRGLGWANWVSGLAWILLIVALPLAWARRGKAGSGHG
jgi:hypothetical protein